MQSRYNMLVNLLKKTSISLFLLTSSLSHAASVVLEPTAAEKQARSQLNSCLMQKVIVAEKHHTIAQLEQLCEKELATKIITDPQTQQATDIELGALAQRIIKERRTAFDPYVITPHKMNYILPVHMTNKINHEAYKGSNWSENLADTEAKFQISIKVPLLTQSLFTPGDQLFFGFTLESWWQIYANNISKPFRETNYQPEFFYFTPIKFHPFGGNSALVFGMEHQSNGRSQALSRSWNRIYVNYLYEKRNFALSFKPWYRLSEDMKENPWSDEGDDNPDILDYMGHFELAMVYKYQEDYEFSIKGRDNFATHKGYAELGITFPLWGKLKGYAQLSTGYGESLIDYNYNQHRLGIGIALTDVL